MVSAIQNISRISATFEWDMLGVPAPGEMWWFTNASTQSTGKGVYHIPQKKRKMGDDWGMVEIGMFYQHEYGESGRIFCLRDSKGENFSRVFNWKTCCEELEVPCLICDKPKIATWMGYMYFSYCIL